MADISVSDLQKIAVECTTQFLNSGVPLSTSLAKQASDLGLNSDQLQRAVEATNTLTYLKSLEVQGDRTSEFPLADFRTIVKQASIPESLDKESPVFKHGDSFEKKAELAEVAMSPNSVSFERAEQWAMMTKAAAANTRKVEDLSGYCAVLADKLTKTAALVKKDPQGLEKLASLPVDDTEFKKLSYLVYREVKPRPDYAGLLFKQASQSEVQTLAGLLKEAQEVSTELKRCKELESKASGLVKEAFIGALAGAAGKALGKGIAGTTKLLTKPVVALAKGTKNALDPAGVMMKSKINSVRNAAANTGVGKAVGITSVQGPPTQQLVNARRRMAMAGVVGGGVLDATSFTPKVDPAKDHSGSVWASLQKPPVL